MLTSAPQDNLPAETLAAIRRRAPLGEPADVADAMAYLASDEAR